ncbi:MAG: preprotein translocase subunit SecG [Cyanobacteria bacterium]|nr:preprotein translocase subunit SecG [Cyanobacteriota bacterium]
MEMLKLALQILQAASAVIFIVLVLLHSPKSDGMGGIGGAAQLFSSQKGAETALNKVTTQVAIVFFIVSFVLGYYF